jgi:hypothetical protein
MLLVVAAALQRCTLRSLRDPWQQVTILKPVREHIIVHGGPPPLVVVWATKVNL